MSKKIAALVALALASFCGLSHALNVSFTGFTHGSQTVNATLASPNGALVKNNVPAGGFLTIVNGGPSFETFCVDLYQTIAFGAPPYPEYSNVGLGHLFTNAHAYTDLSRLFVRAGALTNAMQEAAFQIAVWEIAYEKTDTPYNLGSGAASFAGGTAASSGALTLATTWLTSLGAGGPTIMVLESRLHQDVIFAVPEPSMVLLMAAGLLGVTAKVRRKVKAKV